MDYGKNLGARKVAALSKLTALGVNLPAGIDAVIACDVAARVDALETSRRELAAALRELLDYVGGWDMTAPDHPITRAILAHKIGRLRELAPIAKRSQDAGARRQANTELRELYADLARLQRAGVTLPAIDMGAL